MFSRELLLLLDILLCLFLDITLACVTFYSAFWMTEWLSGNKIVAEADEFTLQILLMKAQGYSTRDICFHFGVDKGVVYGRIRRLRNKIVNKL